MSSLLSLPEEIQVQIFLKLPVKSILSCRRACKILRSLLCSPYFVKTHLDQAIHNPKLMLKSTKREKHKYYLFRSIDYASILSASSALPISSKTCTCDGDIPMDYPIRDVLNYSSASRMLGSCNGLICMALHLSTDIFIWNPSTGECKKMQMPFCISLDSKYSRYGFYYDSIVDDYKLVRIDDLTNGIYIIAGYYQVDVYTLGSRSWKTIHSKDHYVFPIDEWNFYHVKRSNPAYFVNGALHWLGFNTSKEVSSRVIVSFDVKSERFVDILYPKEAQRSNKNGAVDCVGVLEDCLCLGIHHMHADRMDIWLMQDYGIRESWSKRFSFSTGNLFEGIDRVKLLWPFRNDYGARESGTKLVSFSTANLLVNIDQLKLLWCFTNGELLIDTGRCKLLYDPMNDRFKVLKIHDVDDFGYGFSVPLNYVESLVSPKSGTLYGEKVPEYRHEETRSTKRLRQK